MNEPRFGSVITALVTPFDDAGALNLGAARELAATLLENGSDGFVVCGTTGESPTLSHNEKMSLFATVVDEVGDKASVIAGTGTYNTAESVELTKEAASLGVDACLVVTPYYSKPPQNGLIAHFSALADASEVPLMIYDIPGRTARRVERATMVELAGNDRIVAVKDAVGDAQETAKLRSDLDDAGHGDFEIYSGDDIMLMPHLAAGAVGIVSVCSHLIGPHIAEIVEKFFSGDIDEARDMYIDAVPLMSAIMTVTSSPIPVKAALRMLGVKVGEPRLPLVPPTAEESVAISSALRNAGLL